MIQYNMKIDFSERKTNMKKRTFISILSMMLVLIMLLSQATLLISCSTEEENTDNGNDTTDGDNTNGTEGEGGEGEGEEEEGEPFLGTQMANAKFVAEIPSSPSDLASLPSFYHMTKNEKATAESIGFLWNAETLSVLVDVEGLETVAVKIGSYENSFTAEEGLFMKNISFSDTRILPKDIGQLVPVEINATAR